MTPISKTLIKTLHNGENIESIGSYDLKYNIPSELLCFFDMSNPMNIIKMMKHYKQNDSF